MHVVQTHTRYFPHVDGVGSTVRGLSRELVARGHRVTVLCSKVDPERPAIEEIEGVRVRRIPTAGEISDTQLPLYLPVELARIVPDADVLHAHLPTPWTADLTALGGCLSRTPTALTYHNDIVGTGLASHLAGLYNRTGLELTLRLADRITITQPNYLTDSAHLGRFVEKVTVVPNGVDPKTFSPRGEESRGDARPQLFFLALLDENHTYKGLDVLIDTLAQLAETENAAACPELIIGGDGDNRAAYEQQVRDRDLDEHVTFLGYVPEADLPRRYAEADAFVLPSRSSAQEGFGLVLLEALACETPVVTTPVVGIADTIAAEPVGTLVDPDDPAALADGIAAVVDGAVDLDRDRMRTICEERFSWSASVDTLEEVYRELVQ